MRLLTTTAAGMLALLTMTATGAEPAVTDDTITLKTVKYPELVRTVRDLQGKVVVVDFWGVFCIPCKREFPHLVEMQHRYAKDGFAAVSVTVDDARDKEAVDNALKFLRAKGPDFTNLLLDESPDAWADKLKVGAPPFVFVFDRDGRLADKFEGKKANYEEQIEPLVVELLKK